MKFLLSLSLVILIASCSEEETYVPKRYGQLRIDLSVEEKNYVQTNEICGLTTEIPDYAMVFQKDSPDSISCFVDVKIAQHKATINLTYKSVDGNLPEFLEQSATLVHKHLIKADDFQDTLLLFEDKKVYAQVYNLVGNVASPIQFVITDSSDHFMRGSLDFFAKPNYDSIRPVLNYVKKDIYHMIKTLEWETQP